MKTVEIDIDLSLDTEEESRLELHSFHNVMNVILGELQTLRLMMNDETALSQSMALSETVLDSFRDREAARGHFRALETFRDTVLGEVREAAASRKVRPEHEVLREESVENLESVFAVAEVRVREILARDRIAGAWERIPLDEIRDKLRQVTDAIVRNARGRYGIVYRREAQGPADYLVELRFNTRDGETVEMPSILMDTLRDLVANARKYSDPGSRIEAELIEDELGLTLRVADPGRGIPEGEIAEAVRFGFRGSNTKGYETRGGGYGLTKAYYVARQYGGRMWIASAPGEGTVVTLSLPRP